MLKCEELYSKDDTYFPCSLRLQFYISHLSSYAFVVPKLININHTAESLIMSLTQLLINIMYQVDVFWVVTPCSVVGGYQNFRMKMEYSMDL
jgi:hypothetical protein